MGVEAILFAIIGALAILCAFMMLQSENAVHSAMFLIANFICVAVLYIMLEAPFLAMVQIAVYAGAIMVLFLFVIMLLGAERFTTGDAVRRFPWLAPLALVLSMVFILAVGVGLILGQVDNQTPASGRAQLRIVNAASLAEEIPAGDFTNPQVAIAERSFDIFLNNELIAEGISPGEATDFTAYEPGEYSLTFSPIDTEIPFVTATVRLEPGAPVTGILTSDEGGSLSVTTINDDLSLVDRRSGRVTVFNATSQPVSVVDILSEAFADSRQVVPVAMNIAPGEVSEAVMLPEARVRWTVIEAGTEQRVRDTLDPDLILARTNEVNIARDTARLLVVAPLRAAGGSELVTVYTGDYLAAGTSDQFGGAYSIGSMLFIDYLLPFQLVAILLLAAMVGVIVLTLREDRPDRATRGQRRRVSRPLTSVIASQTGSDLSQAPRLAPPLQSSGNASEQPEPAGD